MNWLELKDEDSLRELHQKSFLSPQIIFKHSTRCSISHMALSRFERQSEPIDSASFYYLDLLKFREISNLVAETYRVHHESPQLLLIYAGECTYETSHGEIFFDELREQIQDLGSSGQ